MRQRGERTAERSVTRSDDKLARLALERKAEVETEAEGLEQALDEAEKVGRPYSSGSVRG